MIADEPMPLVAIHPGEHLAGELEELGISAYALARELEVPTNRITGIVKGHRAVTSDTALRLSHFFVASPEFWLNLPTLYDRRVAQQRARKSDKVAADIEATP
jgi:addiction module HigA family antidote